MNLWLHLLETKIIVIHVSIVSFPPLLVSSSPCLALCSLSLFSCLLSLSSLLVSSLLVSPPFSHLSLFPLLSVWRR